MTDFNIEHFLNLADSIPNTSANQAAPQLENDDQGSDVSSSRRQSELQLNGGLPMIFNAEHLQEPRYPTGIQSPMLSAAGSVYGDEEDDLESLLLTPLVTPSATPGTSTAFQRLQLTGVTSIDLNTVSQASTSTSTFIPTQMSATGSGSRSSASINPNRYSPYPQPTPSDKPVTPADFMQLPMPKAAASDSLNYPRFSGPITIPVAPSNTVDTRNLIPVLGNNELMDAQTALTIQNYQALQQQHQQQLQMLKGTMEIRKVNHKIAEQRRRDSIKKCFEELKETVPHIEERNPSRLYILQKTCEYIRRIQQQSRPTDS